METIENLKHQKDILLGVVEGIVEHANTIAKNNKLDYRYAVEFAVKPRISLLTASSENYATVSILIGVVDETNSVNLEDMKVVHEYQLHVGNHPKPEALTMSEIHLMRKLLTEGFISLVALADSKRNQSNA